ncbi:MAG: Eco57I restriction-modification methylase domain-containing protein [Bacteroidaceae bacterium]|nr:Eco57I restriction-modification methylase domain-containing protein [Bacteroidaceae bacterium]
MIDTSALDNVLFGRVEPKIYAFETGTYPKYLKVGDTHRPLHIRYQEWRKYYDDLTPVFSCSAKTDHGAYFRDYAVHDFLIKQRKRERLTREEAGSRHFSNEFFKDASTEDVVDAISDIQLSENTGDGRYQFYSEPRVHAQEHYERTQVFEPRENQQEAIDNFKKAIAAGRRNLLMYAVMRFGKTFTALCCANEIPDLKIVLIVSAKGDVRSEWKKNIESHVKFSDYAFFDRTTLETDTISTVLSAGKKVAIFLTLQDLQGTDIKERHRELFEHSVDLLIIDETHYGARAEEYGRVLRESNISTHQVATELESYDGATNEFEQEVKSLNAKYRLHLSGTPYRILMGDEFEKEDIIAFCQFADIIDAQRAWDDEHFLLQEQSEEDQTECKEWDNPYFGFPQMIRFAFEPSRAAKAKLQELKKGGHTYAFSALFRACSMVKDGSNSHRHFENESEITEIFQAIDGTQDDENVLSFLDLSKIKNGKMCQHIVCVLPYRTSCDALEELLLQNQGIWKNLCDYEVINIAGYDSTIENIEDLKKKIADCESQGKKTISLTVNKFLTGSTVAQWDTMLYFKDTSSPQEYDQAIFRLQNPYVQEIRSDEGVIKLNMKPQTLLVDFCPDRMFHLQELKSLFYNTNRELRGNDTLVTSIDRELKISPIFAINANKMCEITPQNIIDAVRQYTADKSILDEAIDIPFDNVLLESDEIKALIASLKPLKDRKGIELAPSEGEGTDLDIPAASNSASPTAPGNQAEPQPTVNEDDLEKKLAAYYMRILFYAFLTHDPVASLLQVIESIPRNEDNLRISQHVGLDVDFLSLIYAKASEFKLSKLDYTINRVNTLGRDETISPIERANIAMRKLSRISESEVVTPQNVANDLLDMIDEEVFSEDSVILDLATKQGELAYEICKRFPGENKPKIYSVATSRLTYELTRKVYESLGLPLEYILNFTTFSLLESNAQERIERLAQLTPNVIIVVPPYNRPDGGGRSGSGSGSAIYQHFYGIAKQLNPQYIAMFVKANWYSGGRGDGLEEFRQSILNDQHISVWHDYPDPEMYIDTDVALRGGVCRFLWDQNHEGDCEFYSYINNFVDYQKRPLKTIDDSILIRYSRGIDILNKVFALGYESLRNGAYTRNVFKLASNLKGSRTRRPGYLKVYMPRNQLQYINPSKIPNYSEKEPLINSWKVLVAKASPGEDALPHSIISTPFVSEPASLCTDSHLLVRVVESQTEAENLVQYMKTRFFRFMMILAKNNHNMAKDIFRFVPLVDLSQRWDDANLYEHFRITPDEQEYIARLINEPRA